MKKRTGKWKITAVIALMAFLLAGCGSAENTADTTEAYEVDEGYGTEEIYAEDIYTASATADESVEEYAKEEYADESAAAEDSVEVTESAQTSERKLIKTVDCDVETENFDELLSTIETKTDSMGGYIESSYTYNGSSYYADTDRGASLTIRIPADNLDAFLSAVSEESNVISRDESVTDITLEYVDLESHKKALQTEQDRLLELIEQAQNVEDIVTLESRLSEVRYQIESMESQLRTYDNQVSYSTVYLNINEVTTLTPVKEQSVWEKIGTGFLESLSGVGRGLLNFVIFFIIRIPYLVVWAVLIFAAVMIIRALIRHKRKKKEKKAKDRQETGQEPAGKTEEAQTEADYGSRE